MIQMRENIIKTYRPIRDYAIIGDAHTAALVSKDGSIDWCCWPYFDSPAIFCSLLDCVRGGLFRVGPAGQYSISRSYIRATNILETTFTTSGGRFRVIDFMPIQETIFFQGEDILPAYRILRLVEGISGESELEVYFRPTFNFARAEADINLISEGAVATSGNESLLLNCPIKLQKEQTGGLIGKRRIASGDRFWISLSYRTDVDLGPAAPQDLDPDQAFSQTLTYWQGWSQRSSYAGPYSDLVYRSALVLKLLTFEATGAIIAAPTTSLPEEIGGVRNWDYRYTWLRDSALIIYSLQAIGHYEEASDFFNWLDSLCIECGEPQIMYTIAGKPELDEKSLDHLEGYLGSRPVRIGNEAASQKQLDIFGEVLDAAHLYYEKMKIIGPRLWSVLSYLTDQVVVRWREKDQGIWEVRGGARHFLYSKLLCWVALDRAVRLAEYTGLSGNTKTWQKTRAEIHQAILTEGYNEKIGAFTQAFGETVLDASVLAIPLVGFLPAKDPRVLSTINNIKEQLTSHGLVYRYLSHDGLPGGEATFALCSFWLVDNLALCGRVDEARELFERVTAYANDLGLLSEEIDPVSGELLGNFPQGFTHLALIRSALNITKVEEMGTEEDAETAAEREPKAEHAGKIPKV
jgi:alpha,alpha-trehalase